MPFTPYHFGPSGVVGLVLRRWIDVPVFVLANVIVDIEVLFADGWPHHRHWHFHTLLVGAAVGAAWGLTAYPLRHIFKRLMKLIRIPYKSGLWKMIISGILGVWLHVLVDGVYHFDVQPVWPSRVNPLYRLLTQPQVLLVCKLSFAALVILYVIIARPVTKAAAVAGSQGKSS